MAIGITYHSEESRRKVFENYAKEKRFDPLVQSNWYNINGDSIATENKVNFFFLVSSVNNLFILLI